MHVRLALDIKSKVRKSQYCCLLYQICTGARILPIAPKDKSDFFLE